MAARGCYDLTQHQEASGKSMEYFDERSKTKYVPHVIEPSLGVDRLFLAVMVSAYHEDEVTRSNRLLLGSLFIFCGCLYYSLFCWVFVLVFRFFLLLCCSRFFVLGVCIYPNNRFHRWKSSEIQFIPLALPPRAPPRFPPPL